MPLYQNSSVLFSKMLHDHIPEYWVYLSNYKENFITITLDSNSFEYNHIKEELEENYDYCNLKIDKIERIQHPFAYFSFRIKSCQLLAVNGIKPEVKRLFIPIQEKLFEKDIIKYNVDLRRIKRQNICWKKEKKKGEKIYVIVLKILKEYIPNSYPTILAEIRDNEKYPEYLIHLVNDNTNFEPTVLKQFTDKCLPDENNYLNSFCRNKTFDEFHQLFKNFEDTKNHLILQSFSYPNCPLLTHIHEDCKCLNCLLSNILDCETPPLFVFTKRQLKFWNYVLNY